jgi:hypothetical protein
VDGSQAVAAVDLLWIPLGAGGHVARRCGRAWEAVAAKRERRPAAPLYHSALEVRDGASRWTIESAPAVSRLGPDRGVVAVGPVGLRALGRFAAFRYEVRCWPGGTIPDAPFATVRVRVSTDDDVARRVVDLAPAAPTPVWGRDELRAGDMWNSNSLVAWLLDRAGVDAEGLPPPARGRAPGWSSGVVVARRAR